MKPLTLALTIVPLLANAYKGDMTHYTPGVWPNPGSCGIGYLPGQDVVALSKEIMHAQDFFGGNPNNNPRCGWKINIYNEETGESHEATVIDTCEACAREDVDVNEELFYKVAPSGDGRVGGIDWGVVGDDGGLIGG
ncbi:MAG: hypothetical protein L6R40_005263 [Gallowayella cf. fulva]|nr:MAG: hypothetical protein L6R40_005263 [Xanthomendoza cf. fulva]